MSVIVKCNQLRERARACVCLYMSDEVKAFLLSVVLLVAGNTRGLFVGLRPDAEVEARDFTRLGTAIIFNQARSKEIS